MEQQLRLPIWRPQADLGVLTYWEARKALEEEEYRLLGTGACAAAYLTPEGHVIKVCGGDAGARATAEAALAYPNNPHLPKVFWLIDLEEDGFAVECELLECCPGDQFREWSTTRCPGRNRGVTNVPIDGPDDAMTAALKALHDAAARAEEDGYSKIVWDTHDGNIMVRPGTGELVLNDCLYDCGRDAYSRYGASYNYDDYCRCEECTECVHRAGGDCGSSDCEVCQERIEPKLPCTLPRQPVSRVPSWRLQERIEHERQERLHAADRHCGFSHCFVCNQPIPLPLAA
jgi:hypothetical protein